MFQPLDGPSSQIKLTSVGTVTPVEVKVGADPLDDRQVITIQPTGNIRIWFASSDTTPLAATISANGFLHYKDAKESYEAGSKQKVWILAVSGTVDVIIAERA